MNYQKIYNQIIERGQRTLIHGYFETHHIIPRCMGGSDSEENLVELTPEEHYVAHQLLVKIYPNNHKLIYAAKMMSMSLNGRRCNKLYGWLKQRFIDVLKTRTVSQETRDKISNTLKGHTLSDKTRDKISNTLKGNVPWNVGISPSDEARKKLSLTTKGRKTGRPAWNKDIPMTDSRKEQQRINSTGRVHSAESKEKMSIAAKAREAKKRGT